MIKEPFLMSDKENITSQQEEKRDRWFSDFIDHLKADHFMLATDTASEDTKKIYQAFINEDAVNMFSITRETSSFFFIKRLIFSYLKEVKKRKTPSNLALSLSDSKILVWAEIENDDEAAEDALLLAEAEINSQYSGHGFFVESTILEKRDNLPIPPHYQQII